MWSSYGDLLGKLLPAWRSTLQQPDLFFEIVQLPVRSMQISWY